MSESDVRRGGGGIADPTPSRSFFQSLVLCFSGDVSTARSCPISNRLCVQHEIARALVVVVCTQSRCPSGTKLSPGNDYKIRVAFKVEILGFLRFYFTISLTWLDETCLEN